MIDCRSVRFRYDGESFDFRVDSLSVAAGEAVALVGPSGCGKTTLLNLMAGILVPSEGRVETAGRVVSELGLAERQRHRLVSMGMVPQGFELLDYLTVEENLLLPLRLAGGGGGRDEALAEGRERAAALAERAGILRYYRQYPGRLSHGERQRVAFCRGLVAAPQVILADEPTGNLDPENQEKMVSLLLEEAGRLGATLVMITHDPGLLPRFGRVVDVLALRAAAGSSGSSDHEKGGAA